MDGYVYVYIYICTDTHTPKFITLVHISPLNSRPTYRLAILHLHVNVQPHLFKISCFCGHHHLS